MASSANSWSRLPARLARSLGTFEGLMLMGSLVLTGAILTIIWLFLQPDPIPKPPPHYPPGGLAGQKVKNPLSNEPQSQSIAAEANRLAVGNSPQTTDKTPVIRPIVPAPIEKDPSPKRTDPPPTTGRNVPSQPERTRRIRTGNPSQPTQEEPRVQETTPVSPPASAPSAVRTVAVRGREVLLELLDDVSPQGSALGSTIRLRVVRSITIDGLMVVEAGAPATATVTDRKWSEGGRTFLEITLQQVKAVNGTWIPIKYPPISESGNSSNPVEFPRGTRIEARLRDSSLTLAL